MHTPGEAAEYWFEAASERLVKIQKLEAAIKDIRDVVFCHDDVCRIENIIKELGL